MEFKIRCLVGRAVAEYLPDAARLRISVFREFPYLYQGDEASEQDYLTRYSQSDRSVFVLAIAGTRVVGVSTGLPLADADPAFRRPFELAGRAPGEWFYLGESVLEPAWRGKGIGHLFFEHREARAKAEGFAKTCFCAVERLHAPPGYRPHDSFWTKRGYSKQPDLSAKLKWPRIDSDGREVENELVFWTRDRSPQM